MIIIPELNAIKHTFPNIIIIPCFYHFMQNISKRIPELKSKIKKNLSKSNIKLLSFIPLKKFDEFYDNIKKKYKSDYKKFFDYFDKYQL